MQLPRTSSIAKALAATIAAVTLCAAGCGRLGQDNKPVKGALTPLPGKVEVLADGSDIMMRRHVYGGPLKDTIVETHVTYRDGRSGSIYYNPDTGLLRETKEFTRAKTLRSHAVYEADGKTLKRGELYRPDGSLKLVKSTVDGVIRSDYYWTNGKWIFFSDMPQTDGSVMRTVYRRDGAVWSKSRLVYLQNVRHNPITETVVYSLEGLPQFRALRTGSGRVFELLRSDGSVCQRQTWRYGGDSVQHELLESVVEIGFDGRTPVAGIWFAEKDGVVTPLYALNFKYSAEGVRVKFSGASDGAALTLDVYENPFTGEKRKRSFQPCWVASEQQLVDGVLKETQFSDGEKQWPIPAADQLVWPAVNGLQNLGWHYEQVREWAPWDEEPKPGDDVIRSWYYGQAEWYQI